MQSLVAIAGTPLPDGMSDEADVFAALLAAAEAGDEPAVRMLEISLGLPLGRLLEDYHYLRRTQAEPLGEPAKLIRRLLDDDFFRGLHLVYDGQFFSIFEGGGWAKLTLGELKHRLFCKHQEDSLAYGDEQPSRLVEDAVKHLKLSQYRKNFPIGLADAPAPAVSLLNGELWFLEGGDWELRPHKSSSRITSVSPVQFDPDAVCPMYDDFVAEAFSPSEDPADMVRHLHEVMGYGFQPGRPIPAIVALLGVGANGKSTALKIWTSLVGLDQTLFCEVDHLARDRFSLPSLAGQRMLVDDDVKDNVRLNDGLLKRIAEDKALTTRRAYGADTVTFRSRALPVLAVNGAVVIGDTTHGIARRLITIPFQRQFSDEEMDPQLADKIIAQERSGVLNRLIEGYSRLAARGHFDPPEECKRAKDIFLGMSNPLRGFLSEVCLRAEGKRTRANELYDAFCKWCRLNRLAVPYPRKAFTGRLKGAGVQLRKSNGYLSAVDLEIGDLNADGETF